MNKLAFFLVLATLAGASLTLYASCTGVLTAARAQQAARMAAMEVQP
ncbi:MAG: hypothetical protein KAY22_05560 [Rhizorhabdus sp.]|nr:hypothetical protein [Rhizorhabdus sp.]MBP8231752.1 hypothetical protein [Rhizorhabdus sp.]